MDMNRKFSIPEPAAASSGRPRNPNEGPNANPFALMSPSRPPKAPTSVQPWQKRYFMSQVGGSASGASGSGTNRTSSDCFQTPNDPLYMKATNNQTEPNLSSLSDQKPTLAAPAGDSSSKIDVGVGVGAEHRWCRKLDLSMDPRRLKRTISNRLSAQRSRVKKLQHVAEMEKEVQHLENQVAVLSPQVEYYKSQKCYLEMEQKELKDRIEACANRKILVDAEIEANKEELIRLRQLQITKQQEKLEEQARMAAWEPAGLSQQEQMGIPGDLNQLPVAGEGMFYVDPNQVDDDVGDNIADMNQLCLNQQQEETGEIPPMPGWELTDLGFNLGGPHLVKNPATSSRPRHRRIVSLIPEFGGIEQILNFNPEN